MTEREAPKWPREIWAAETEDGDPLGTHVFSVHATVARWPSDYEREAEYHRYVDGDVLDTAERYYRERIEQMQAAMGEREVSDWSEAEIRAAFHHFMHDAEYPCSASAFREAATRLHAPVGEREMSVSEAAQVLLEADLPPFMDDAMADVRRIGGANIRRPPRPREKDPMTP